MSEARVTRARRTAYSRSSRDRAQSSGAEGPKLWAELHARELADPADERRWLENFRLRVRCDECRRHWDDIVTRTPPDLSGANAYFRWGVERHNEVNRMLSKPEMSVEAAVAKWRSGAADLAAPSITGQRPGA